jgi:hypothetical protein
MAGQEVQVADSDLVEVVKRNGEFRKWGWFWGPLLYWLSIKAAKATRPRSLLWSGVVALGTVSGSLVLKYGLPTFG